MNMETKVKIKVLGDGVILPKYETPGSACADVRAYTDEPIVIRAGERTLVPTGFSLEFEPQTVALIFARSGLASKKGVSLSNGVGVIDSDYRGEVKIALVNNSSEDFTVNGGDRIAQMGFFPVCRAQFESADMLSDTERGDGGFGHTGV